MTTACMLLSSFPLSQSTQRSEKREVKSKGWTLCSSTGFSDQIETHMTVGKHSKTKKRLLKSAFKTDHMHIYSLSVTTLPPPRAHSIKVN